MKIYQFYELPGTGPGKYKKQGSLVELLQSIPYLLTSKRLPPLHVLNSIFAEGGVDSGMSGGCQWVPFTITKDEYTELVKYYQKTGFEITQPPSWVRNWSDYHIWQFEKDHGIPSKKHKELSDLESAASARLKAAIKSGASDDKINKLHLEAYRAGCALSEFLDVYLQANKR